MNTSYSNNALEDDGFYTIAGAISGDQCDQMLRQIEAASESNTASIRSSKGTVYAARNLIETLDDLPALIQSTGLDHHLKEAIGDSFGLVRVLYFDKPSDRSWVLPFHKDLTIAVEDNSHPSDHFSKPTRKSGVDHVEASEAILENMLTLRIHLDEVTEANGPLQVIPGSHQSGKTVVAYAKDSVKILVNRGDVLAMRPMISHASGHTDPDKKLHRRILHLEFCGMPELPDGYRWKNFLPCRVK